MRPYYLTDSLSEFEKRALGIHSRKKENPDRRQDKDEKPRPRQRSKGRRSK